VSHLWNFLELNGMDTEMRADEPRRFNLFYLGSNTEISRCSKLANHEAHRITLLEGAGKSR